MKILYLIYHGFSENSGISKKILFQIKALRELGHEVNVCTYTFNAQGERVRMIDDTIIENYGCGKWAAMKKRCCYYSIYQYVVSHHIELVYVRSFHNANPFTIHLFQKLKKAGIKSVMEIPTYPYDKEYVGFPFITRLGVQIDRLFRNTLAKQMDAIVTFSNHNRIFGQRTIRISNGVDFDSIPLKKSLKRSDSAIHLIGVAEVHYWHGYDRLIDGLGKYYQCQPDTMVYFHIVGGVWKSEMYDSEHAPGFHELITKYHLEKYVIFHGQKMDKELDELFNNADFAIGSLARHRSGIDNIKTLKNREYAARGIPFIYSEIDEDFEDKPYVMKAAADESSISIHQLIQFYKKANNTPKQIRASIQHLSWKSQMKIVIDQL